MAKQTKSGKEARAALLSGLNQVVDAVKQTLGPRGRNVLLSRPMQPLATRDGVTVAKEVANLPDPFEQMGALYARECADAAVVLAGDGTTTTCVILQAIMKEGLKLVDAGAEPLLLADGIQIAANYCAEFITAMAIPATPELVRQAAIISTHGDIELGTMIAEATCKVGASGVLELQDSRDETTTIEHLEGFYFERGWNPHQAFAKDRTGQKCILDKPLILISERLIVGAGLRQMPDGGLKAIDGDGIGAILMKAIAARRPLLVVAEGLEGDALQVFAANVLGGQTTGCFVKLPGFGEHRAAALEDLRIAVGAKRIHSQTSTEQKDQLSSFGIEDLGFCEQAIISRGLTVLIGGGANTELLKKRVMQLGHQAQQAENPYIKAQLDHRIARLTGGVAALRVGGKSEPEMLERKSRAEDCIHACRGALEQGVVPGGGVALLRASDYGKGTAMMEVQDDVSKGVRLLLDAIREPARQIFRNAGQKDPGLIVDAIRSWKGAQGFDASVVDGKAGDLYSMGIVDPLKVVLVALQKAASIGALLLTSEVLCADIPEPTK